MKLHEGFTEEESDKIYTNFLAIVNDSKRRDRLVKIDLEGGPNAEDVAYGTAVNQVKKQAADKISKSTTKEPMEDVKLKEMVKAALSKPLSEKKKSPAFTSKYDDKFTDGRKKLPDGLQDSILKKQGNLDEDLDLGHEDNEPHMIKSELYQIGTYAMELYKMVSQFEGEQEVDFPGWWQSKITTARNMISSAKHYLEFELNEPKIDTILHNRQDSINEGDVVTVDQIEGLIKKLKAKGGLEKYVKTLSDDIESLKKGPSPQIAVRYKMLKDKLGENTLEEKMTPKKSKEIGMPFKNKIKEAGLAKMKQK